MKKSKDVRVGTRIFGEGLGLVISLVILYGFMPRLTFVTSDYATWLPIGVQAAIISAMLRIYGRVYYRTRYLMELLAIGVGFYSTFKLLAIFPFDFGVIGFPYVDNWFKMALAVALVAISIGALVNMVKMIVSWFEIEEDRGKED